MVLFPCKNTISVSSLLQLYKWAMFWRIGKAGTKCSSKIKRFEQVMPGGPQKIRENLKCSYIHSANLVSLAYSRKNYGTANILAQRCYLTYFHQYWVLLALWVFTYWIGNVAGRGEIRQDIAYELSCSKRKRNLRSFTQKWQVHIANNPRSPQS